MKNVDLIEKGKTADQIAPYRKVIQEQFVISNPDR